MAMTDLEHELHFIGLSQNERIVVQPADSRLVVPISLPDCPHVYHHAGLGLPVLSNFIPEHGVAGKDIDAF